MPNNPFMLQPAVIKTLSAVEANPVRSNQHEFNGVAQLIALFGLTGRTVLAKFSVLGSQIEVPAKVTWYDARAAHPTRTEYRLYFQTNTVMQTAQEGDHIIIGFDSQNTLNIILVPLATPGYFNNNEWIST